MADALRMLRDACRLMIGRAMISLVNDGGRLQTMQLRGLADEVLEDVERLQEYGVFSVPLSGMEALIACQAGDRGSAVVVACDSREHRPKNSSPGDSGLYSIFDDPDQAHDAAAHRIALTQDGGKRRIVIRADEISIKTGRSTLVMNDSGLHITAPDVQVDQA